MTDEVSTARELLRAHGLKRTVARVSVLRYLLSVTTPQTATQIEDGVAEHGFNPSTIYRTLESLTEAGLVIQRELGDRLWRFEMRDPTNPLHPHLLCIECGSVHCVKVSEPLDDWSRLLPQGFELAEIILRGRCQECSSA